MRALYQFFTPLRRFIINIFPGQLWMDFCCHWHIHQDVECSPSRREPGKIDHYCTNPSCHLILWQTEKNPKKQEEPKLNWSLEA